ncbi:hypothetical protein [Chryseobacterium sp. JK1]|uniref:hypothetical protein n=1 Tax=Chryseobacterium sp. JK1 TaxID=874294 RepID=UPI003D684DFC
MLKIKRCNISEMAARLGGLFCDEEPVVGFIFADRRIRLDPASFTKTKWDEFIQKDWVIGTVKYDAAEDANVDPTYTDLTTGESIKQNDGIKKWNTTYYKGNCFQNELQKLDKSQRYSIFVVFQDGSMLGQLMKDGKVKGFDVRLFTGIKNVKTAAEGGGSTLRIDLTRDAMTYWQRSSVLVESTEMSFTELNPVTGVNLKVLSPLVAGATSTKIEISNMCANSTVIGLETPAKWKMRRNGVLEAVTAITEVNGVYTYTHAALVAGDNISFEINDGGYSVYVLDTDYYAGKTQEEKVA